MKIVAMMPARNEDWILGYSARAVLMWADALVIMEHASTDDTVHIASALAIENPGRVFIAQDSNKEWREMAHRQRLLELARSIDATHMAIVDADEVLSANLLPVIRQMILRVNMLQLPWVCLSAGAACFYSSGVWGTNWVTTAFRDKPEYHWAQRDGYDFHHRHPLGSSPAMAQRPVDQGSGGLLHYQFASRRRLRAKQALYKVTELIRWPGRTPVQDVDKMYNRAVYESEPLAASTLPVPLDWVAPYDQFMKHLDIDREPWQEHECRRLVNQYGREKFIGLDLFGVI